MRSAAYGDAFGFMPADYKHFAAYGDADAQRAMLAERAEFSGHAQHNFDSLGKMYGVRLNDADMDAQALTYATNSLQAIQSQVNEILYVKMRAPRLVHMNEQIPEGATSYAYRIVDYAGQAEFISTTGSNAPPAHTNLQLRSATLEYGGIVPQWTLQDMRSAMMSGVPLDRSTVRGGTIGAANKIDQVAIAGSTREGFVGLTNHPQIPRVQSTVNVLTADPEDVLVWLQDLAGRVIEQTSEVFGDVIEAPLIIYAPYKEAIRLTSRYRAPGGTDMTVWKAFTEGNPYSEMTGTRPELVWVKELANAGKDGTTNGLPTGTDVNRVVSGFRHPDVAEMGMSISPRVVRVEQMGLLYRAPIEFNISGVNYKHPQAFTYWEMSA